MDADLACSLSFNYKHVDGQPVGLRVHLPNHHGASQQTTHRPTIIYFHAGGLTVGNSQSWFPTWLQKRLSDKGFIFISVDYRLLPPATGHHLVEDIQDAFRFVAQSLNDRLRERYSNGGGPDSEAEADARPLVGNPCRVNPAAIGVAGTSAGGLCAYLACMHANPKPKVVLSMYGMGGNFLIPQYFMPKTKPFFRGRELLDPQQFSRFLYPQSSILEPISDSPLTYHPSTHHVPGYPSNPRMLLARLYLQLGTILDYYTGEHEPSLSVALRDQVSANISASTGTLSQAIPGHCRPLFPQLGVTPTWPPTCFVHGSSDTAVLVEETRHLHSLLLASQVDVMFRVVDAAEHSFDYAPQEDGTLYQKLYDDVVGFLTRHLI